MRVERGGRESLIMRRSRADNDMTDSKLPEAGKIQVIKKRRYGSLPEDLLEDKRLSLDARLVAAWLEIKPDGWIVKIGHLRWALGIPGDTRWSRIASELQDAGYLKRRRVQGEGGRWGWEVTFVSFDFAESTSSEPGFSGFGSSASGTPEAGRPGDEVVPTKPVSRKGKTTTTTTGATTEPISWPTMLNATELQALTEVLDTAPDDPKLRQELVNELARKLELHEIRVGPVPYLRELVRRARKGRFQPNAGVVIAARSARQQAIQAANAAAENARSDMVVRPRAPFDSRQAIAEMNGFIQRPKHRPQS